MRAELRPREVEVLFLVAQGWSNDEIAGGLGVGLETVKTYVADRRSSSRRGTAHMLRR